MSGAMTIASKEFRTFFKTPVAYVFLCAFLALTGFTFFSSYFSAGEASMRNFFGLLPWMFLLFIPAVSMRMWAEERKIGTIETLLTMPLPDTSIVLGKFLAALGLVAVMLLLTFPVPIIVASTAAGPVDLGPIFGGYFGALCLAGAYLAMGLFASAVTENQIVAFILGVGFALLFFIMGLPQVVSLMPTGLGEFLNQLSLKSHFENIGRGVIDTRDVLYYVSMLTFFLMLNVQAVRNR